MASKEFLEKAYLAYFGRPVDPVGAYAFKDATQAEVEQAFYNSPESQALYGTGFGAAQINAIYQMLFGRDAEPAGSAYWLNEITLGHLTPAGAAIGIMGGALNQDAVAVSNKLVASANFTSSLNSLTEAQAYVGNAAAESAREFLKSVTSLPATDAQVQAQINGLVELAGPGVHGPGNLFTLTEAMAMVTTPATPAHDVLYWGYNPHPHNETSGVDNLDGNNDANGNDNNLTNEGPADGGVPVFGNGGLLAYLEAITGLDLAELLSIDGGHLAGGAGVSGITVTQGDNGSSTISATSSDGKINTAQVQLGQEYFKLLHDALFDEEGNSRLYMKSVVDTPASTSLKAVPIVLTQKDNNGGTIETDAVTSARDDLIVAGRLELLHQAYIDAGAGNNILEIDAKGTYAQPALIKNVQEIRVNDLPNFYTTAYGDGSGNLQNTAVTSGGTTAGFLSPTGSGSDDSWLDLNRALDVTKLVITDQGNGSSGESFSGNLTIVGVRNAATLRLEGGFNSGTTTVQYGEGQTGTLNVELALGDVTADINLLQNAAVLNIDSQGVENHMHSFFAGGSISRMIVSGTGVFAVDENLASSFNAGRPVIIDASANTGGLDVTLADGSGSGDLGFYNVKVTGTTADDEITVTNVATTNKDGKVVIAANNGDNYIVTDGSDIVSVTTGTGNDTIYSKSSQNVTIVAGDGTNVVNTDATKVVDITTGAGKDTISAKDATKVTIVAGDGTNSINTTGSVTVTVTTGTGNDTITSANSSVVTIDAGNGNNTILVEGKEISITTGTGNDKVTIAGTDDTFDNGDGSSSWNDDNYGINSHFADSVAPGALLTLDLGAGTNTLYLGWDIDLSSPADGDFVDAGESALGITALEGSVISGTGIKLFVENNSDLTQADLTGATITSVVLKQELRITAEQFSDIGSAAFSVLRDEEGATEDLYVVVNSDTVLSELVDLAHLNTNVRLHFELHNGAELTLSAAELNKYVAWHGIDSTDGLNGKVKITDAGLNFDAFDNGNNYQVIDGGSLTDSFSASEDVTIIRTVTGFERPAPAVSSDVLTIDSNVTPVVATAIISEVATLKVIGSADITFSKAVDLGRDPSAAVLGDGRLGDLANNATPTANPGVNGESDAFTIDFSALTGKMNGLTVANFQDVKQVKGNGSATTPVRVDVELTDGGQVGFGGNANGLKSTGVQTYVVTAIGDDSVGEDSAASAATFYVCDLSVGVKTLGLRGNYNDTINFKQVNWGTNFLLEAGGAAKADGNPSYANIGNLHGEYFWTGSGPHAASTVTINNQGVALTKPINVASIDIDYADSIALNVADGDLVIGDLSGSSLNALTVVSANSVTVGIGANLLDGKIGSTGATTTSVIDGTAVAGAFVLNMSGDNDFSKATLSGIDSLKIVDNATVGSQVIALTLSADQVVTLGAVIDDTTTTDSSILNVKNFGTQVIDFTAIDVDALGTVTVTDTGTSVVVDPGTVFGNAAHAVASLAIVADASDTSVVMTAAQFQQLNGDGTVTGSTSASASTGKEFVATLVLKALATNEALVLSSVAAPGADGVSVVVQVENLVATKDFSVTGHAATLEVTGTVDLTKATVPHVTDINAVKLAAGSVLTLTAAQVLAIGIDDIDANHVAENWSGLAGATLNITGLSTEALDLDALAAVGINIGTLTLLDSNGSITLNAATTLGDADSIITPTKDVNDTVDGVEPTTLNLTAAQFAQLAGAGTITGDATVNITDLANNFDSDGNFTLDVAKIDVSGITAKHGVLSLGANTVTLDAASSITGFDLHLTNGQMIKFSTAAQASGQMVTEVSGTTAVAWLFSTITTPIDTSKYDSDINTLFVLEDLVDGKVEESLWTTLADSIVVEKVNVNGFPDVLIAFDRVNTFQALTAIAGVNYDNQAEFESTANLTINLEGNTNIGNVTVGDTNGEAIFSSLTINSYEDRTTLTNDNNFTFQPNKVGNISLNAGSADELVDVTLNTYVRDGIANSNGFNDAVNVAGPAAERDGLELDVGTITFAANTVKSATLTLTGAEDVKITAVNIADAEVNLLDINATGLTGDLTIGAIAPVDGLTTFAHIYVIDGHTTTTANALTEMATAGNNLLVVAGGTNDLTKASNLDIDKVHFTQNGTLTLTAAQVVAIGTADGADADLIADAWSAVAALNVTLNIVDLDSATASMALNLVAAAGINIGTITIKDTDATVTINTATNLGGADSIIVPEGTTLNLTAKQFEQLDGTGTITGQGAGLTQGKVNIDDLTGAEASIDLTGVTAQNGTITISHTAQDSVLGGANDKLGGTDVALTAAAKLAAFSVTLDDLAGTATANELVGQTIRFANAAQAERTIIVNGEDGLGVGGVWNGTAADYLERDTNVVWNFNTITGTLNAGKIDTSKYDGGLGRVWVNDQLVNGQNVESIFSSPSAVQANPTTGLVNLNSTTIIRVVNTAALDTLLPFNESVNRTVEVESFTSLPAGLIFSNPDKLVGVTNLTFDLGGATHVGNISVDDIVAAAIINDNEFGTLTINSLLANNPTHYLLPEGWDATVNPLPSDLLAAQQLNNLGNISSGATRDELARVTINATGTGLNTGTITFSDDGDLTPADASDDDPTAVLTVTGTQNVNITSVNTADAAITALTVNVAGYTGTLTAPGASPALQLNNTETLTFINDGVPSADDLAVITLGRDAAGAVTANAGVAGNELSVINAAGYDGELNLGILAQLDSTNDDSTPLTPANDGLAKAFTFTSGTGLTTATLAAANGLTPTLNAGSEWVFNYGSAAAGSYLKITPTAVLTAGSTLTLNSVPLVIEGAVSLSQLVDTVGTAAVEGLIITGGSIEVLAGSTLTLTAAQVATLGANIFGEGTLKLIGDASNLTLGANIQTAIVDISAVTLIAAPAAGADLNDTVALTLAGGLDHANVAIAQTIIGSGNMDAITTTSILADTITGGAGNDTLAGGAGNDTYNVNAGTDTIVGLATGDVLVVTAGATADASVATGFVATAATVNNGTVVLTDSDINANSTIDVSLATGSGGFTLTGGTSNAAGLDILVGSSKADTINGGNDNQGAGSIDTLTGGAGADVFEFTTLASTPAVMTQTVQLPLSTDQETVNATVADAAAAGTETITINYDLNGIAATVQTAPIADTTSLAVIEAAVAAALDGVAGITASVNGGQVVASGDNGRSLNISGYTLDGGTGWTAGTLVIADGTDVVKNLRVDIANTVVSANEVYTVTTALAEGGGIIGSYTAIGGDTNQDVAQGIAANFNFNAAAGTILATADNTSGTWGVTFTDEAANDGAFTATLDRQGTYGGSGASDIGASALATADLITDFVSGSDKVSLGVVAGSATNYQEAAESASFAAAKIAAAASFDGTVQYYLTSIADNTVTAAVNDATGLLFFDANADGTLDGVVALTGISSANFTHTDIIV